MDSYIGTEAVICLIFSWSLLWKILIKGPNGKKKNSGHGTMARKVLVLKSG